MTPKKERLERLQNIIRSHRVANQEELLTLLSGHGYDVTQATLSRDLKELKVAKMPDGLGGYYYKLPDAQHLAVAAGQSGVSIASKGVRSVEISGQMCVVKTIPGYANMIATILDASLGREIMGSIAGDDTILVIVRADTDTGELLSAMEAAIPGIASMRI